MEHTLSEHCVGQSLHPKIVETYIRQVEKTLVDFLCSKGVLVSNEREVVAQSKQLGASFYMKKFREILHTLLSLQELDLEVNYMERGQISISDEISGSLPLLHFSVQKKNSAPRDALFLNAQFHGNETLGSDILLSFLQKQSATLTDVLSVGDTALYMSLFPNPRGTIHNKRGFFDGADPLRNFQEDFTQQERDACSDTFRTNKRGFMKLFQLLGVSGQKKSSSRPRYMGKETSVELQAVIVALQELSTHFNRLLFVDIHSGTFAPGVLSPTYASSSQQQNFYHPLFADITQYLTDLPNKFSSSFSLGPFVEYHRHGDFTELLSLQRIVNNYFGEEDNRMMRDLYFLTVEADGIGYDHFVQRIKKKRNKLLHLRKRQGFFSKKVVMYIYLVLRYFMQSPRMKRLNPSKGSRRPLTANHVDLLEKIITFFATHETPPEGE